MALNPNNGRQQYPRWSAQQLAEHQNNLRVSPTDCYVTLHHIGKTFILPVDPDAVSDNMNVSFAENNPLSRSAPIYSYQNSGPRSVQATWTLHRDLCREFNPDWAKAGQDPVDLLVTNLDALVLPDYNAANKIVNPPLVSLKIRDEVYIKGVVTGSVGITYNLPIINYGTETSPSYKYAMITISFGVSEITPYSASILPSVGGKFRGPYNAVSTPSSAGGWAVGDNSRSWFGGSNSGAGTMTQQYR